MHAHFVIPPAFSSHDAIDRWVETPADAFAAIFLSGNVALTGSLNDVVAASWGTIAAQFQQTPELVLALGFAALFPLLTIGGLLVPRPKRQRDNGQADVDAEAHAALATARPVLRLVTAPGEALPWPIGPGGVRIGSCPECDVRLDGPSIEHLHAVVIPADNGRWRILRMASADGVGIYLDGERVADAELDGDHMIKIGAHVIAFARTCHGLDEMRGHCDMHERRRAATHDTAEGRAEWRVETTGAAARPEAPF